MPDPSSVLPSVAKPPKTVPHIVVRKRRRIIIVAIAVVVTIFVVFAGLSIWLLRTSAPPSPARTTNELPTAGEALPTPVTTLPPGAAASPAPASLPATLLVSPAQNNLAVRVQFTRTPQFQLAVSEVARTIENPTTSRREPVAGSAFSLLRVRDGRGEILAEEPFTVPTQVELISAVPGAVLPVHELATSSVVIVVPVEASRVPATVEIVTADGRLFDTQSFLFNNLPKREQAPVIRAHAGAAVRGREEAGPLAWLRAQLGLLVVDAQQDSAPRCSSNCFNIIVTGTSQAAVERAADEVQRMIDTLEPWTTYAAQINVRGLTLTPEADLRCFTIEGVDGVTYPLCPDGAAVTSAIAGVAWHSIIVATDVECNCGTVEDISSSDVAAIGKNAGADIVGHEMGHSVGRLVDEYYYQFGVQGGPLGPNCFSSEQSCQDTTADLTDVTCALGCRAVNSWRPSSQKMHSILAGEYGQLETCIMAEQIRKVVGGAPRFGECEAPEKKIEPPPPPAREGDYYGGSR